MNRSIATFAFLVSAIVAAETASAVGVSGVTTATRWPWNGLVDVSFSVSGTAVNTFYRTEVSATGNGVERVAKTFLSDPIVSTDGTYRVTWDFGADWPNAAFSNLTMNVAISPLSDDDPVYLVIDVSAGKNAASYPHRYTYTPPDVSDDTCKTSEIWFRRCPAGAYTMGYGTTANYLRYPKHGVILTKPFYLGVFELTQQQYYNLEGEWPSYFSNVTYRATRPVEMVAYEDFRGARTAASWYTDNSSLPSSPLTRFRNKTGFLTADLPTEAQWEYACRAGSTGAYYLAEINEDNVNNYGRSNLNKGTTGVNGNTAPDVGGTALVGSFPANNWGFYDMYGNVTELCGDGNRYDNNSKVVLSDFLDKTFVDPRSGPNSLDVIEAGAYTIRGGHWNLAAMNNYDRRRIAGSTSKGRVSSVGVRICITCE